MESEIWTLRLKSSSEGADEDLRLRSIVQFQRMPPSTFPVGQGSFTGPPCEMSLLPTTAS